MATSPEDLLGRLAAGLGEDLGNELLSLSVHGSWLAGDFKLGRSDLDLLAVLAHDPGERMLARLADLHAAIVAQAPEWDDHVEVDYVSVDAVAGVLAGDTQEHSMVRISPGEPIHLLLAHRHCVNLSAKALCVLSYWPGGDWPEPAPDPVWAEPALADLAETIRLAPSLPDQRTWFDAEVALPR